MKKAINFLLIFLIIFTGFFLGKMATVNYFYTIVFSILLLIQNINFDNQKGKNLKQRIIVGFIIILIIFTLIPKKLHNCDLLNGATSCLNKCIGILIEASPKDQCMGISF